MPGDERPARTEVVEDCDGVGYGLFNGEHAVHDGRCMPALLIANSAQRAAPAVEYLVGERLRVVGEAWTSVHDECDEVTLAAVPAADSLGLEWAPRHLQSPRLDFSVTACSLRSRR